MNHPHFTFQSLPFNIISSFQMYRYVVAATALLGLGQAQFQTFMTVGGPTNLYPICRKVNSIAKRRQRPGDEAIALDIRINTNPQSLAPGYIFMTPYADGDTANLGGPQIFKNDGVGWSYLAQAEYHADIHRPSSGKALIAQSTDPWTCTYATILAA